MYVVDRLDMHVDSRYPDGRFDHIVQTRGLIKMQKYRAVIEYAPGVHIFDLEDDQDADLEQMLKEVFQHAEDLQLIVDSVILEEIAEDGEDEVTADREEEYYDE